MGGAIAAGSGGATRLTRRAALGALAWGTAGAIAAGPRAARATDGGSRRLTLHNTHTQESLSVEYWRAGRYDDAALAAVDRVLRDHRDGSVHPIDRTLLDLLWRAAAYTGLEPEFSVISGYRSPASNAALHARSAGVSAHSLHVLGQAIDVRLAGCDLARLRDAGLALAAGGVGYYPGPQFVHLDTGRVRSWSG